jgi:hypothetical protein
VNEYSLALVLGPQNGTEKVYKITNCSRDKAKDHLRKLHHTGPCGPCDPADSGPARPHRSTGECPNLCEPSLLALFKFYLIKWIVLAHIAFNQVENEHFRVLMYFINLTVELALPRSGNTVRAWILKLYEQHREKIAKMLRDTPYQLHFGFDMWTSPNGLAMLGIVVHWMDAEERKHDTLVGLRAMQGSHTGEHMFEVLWGVIEELRVKDKLGYFVLDNAHSNTHALHFLENRLSSEEASQPFYAAGRRMHCFGHMLNLVAKRILFGESVNINVGAECETAEDEQAAINQEVRLQPLPFRK